MRCTDWMDVNRHWSPGDVVWASAFKYTHDKTGKHLHQRPIKGMLAAGPKPADQDWAMARHPCPQATHFVPFKKGTSEPAWSRAVTLYARMFADTEAEATELYDGAIQDAIAWHEDQITMLNGLRIKEGK